MSKRVIGLDIETVDPLLKTAGFSWKYRQGYILCTALYYEAEDEVKVIAGLHNENCKFNKFERTVYNNEIIYLLSCAWSERTSYTILVGFCTNTECLPMT